MALLHSATGWWIDEAGAPEPREPLRGFGEADHVVIGGGYLGMWTAWQLLEREPGSDVVLLEAERCGHGPSGRNGGFVNGYWSHVPEMAAQFGAERAVATAHAADDSVRAIGAFCKSRRLDAWYRAVPQVEIATSRAQDGNWSAAAETLRALGHGDELRALSPPEVQEICRSPVFRAGSIQRTAATVHPARLAFGLRAALIERGVRVHEQTDVLEVRDHDGGVLVRCAGDAYVRARSAILAAGSRTLGWPGFGRELSVASSHIVLTEPVPDVIERIGWTGGEPLADCRRMLHYFRTTNDARILFGWGGGRLAYDARPDIRLELDADVIGAAAAALHRFFPLLADREITHAWGGPIDVAPRRLPIYRSRGALHAGWGFTGHGVGAAHLGGRIMSGLALGVRDEMTTLPLVAPPVKGFPPEPLRFVGGSMIRRALVRKDALDDRGARVGPVTAAIASLPQRLGLNLPR